MSLRARLILLFAILSAGAGSRMLLARHWESEAQASPSALARPLDQFPRQLGDWIGVDEAPPTEVLDMMKLDDFLQRAYRHPSGEKVVLWIGFSKTSRDQYHYPTVCMQGHGWTEEESQRVDQPAGGESADPQSLRTRFRFCRENRDRQYVYYWYYLIGERGIDRAMRGLSQSSRFFLRGRSNASATIEIFSQSPAPDLRLLDAFADSVAKALNGWMPKDSQARSRLGASL